MGKNNAHAVLIRGLTAEEHRMLSALAANSPHRFTNGYVLALIREALERARRGTPAPPQAARQDPAKYWAAEERRQGFVDPTAPRSDLASDVNLQTSAQPAEESA